MFWAIGKVGALTDYDLCPTAEALVHTKAWINVTIYWHKGTQANVAPEGEGSISNNLLVAVRYHCRK
jgi:hypothetical protein